MLWWNWHHDRPAFIGFAGLKCSIQQNGDGIIDPAVHFLRNDGPDGISADPRALRNGGNSGYQAINLAILAGSKEVILIGFDAREPAPGAASHWFGNHPVVEPSHVFALYRNAFDNNAASIADAGVQVVNCSPGTAITAFPRKTLAAALTAAGDKPLRWVQGMMGLGDNIYQRAVIRELVDDYAVLLETAWPQLYADLPMRCVEPITTLRTQTKNINAWSKVKGWSAPPVHLWPTRISYAGQDGTVLEALCKELDVYAEHLTFDLPMFTKDRERPPYIVIRPATVRREWPAAARNPLPQYLAMAAAMLRDHFHIVSVADLSPGVEDALLPLPVADETLHAGELSVSELLALVQGAAAVVGGVGWLVPAAVAAQVPMLLIYGGWGNDNGPQRIFDERMSAGLVEQFVPQRFCRCRDGDHGCDKTIDNFERRLRHWALGLVACQASPVAARVGNRLVSGESGAV